MTTDDMLHVMEWHNGEKDYSPFSDAEMKRRQDDVRGRDSRHRVVLLRPGEQELPVGELGARASGSRGAC